MRSIKPRPVAALPIKHETGLLRDDIAVMEADPVYIDQSSVPRGQSEPSTMHGCEVLKFPAAVVIREFPVTENWCEIVPVHRRLPQPINRESAHGYRTSV